MLFETVKQKKMISKVKIGATAFTGHAIADNDFEKNS